MYPDLPKIELFARQARLGWSAWGNEVVPGMATVQLEDQANVGESH
jgi:N6-adenosine-specific RNA methylase IME4